jgi:hypothetical protein
MLLMLNVAIFTLGQSGFDRERLLQTYYSASLINCAITSSVAAPLGIVKILPGRLAFNPVTAFFGQIPMHLVSMIRTSRR